MNTNTHSLIALKGIILMFPFLLHTHAAQPFLTNPVKTGDHFECDLQGESKTGYVIEQTSDWNTYLPVWTNQTEYPSTHAVRFSITSNLGFFRARQLPTSLFRFAMVSQEAIILNGTNYVIDSFDSSDPWYSTGGAYDPGKRKDQGDVAAWKGITRETTTAKLDVLGHVLTAPGANLDIGTDGSVGSHPWVNGGNNGIQPGFDRDDLNVDLPNIEPPFLGGAFTPGAGVVNGRAYTYVFGNGKYQMSRFNMSGTKAMIVTGQVVLYVAGNFSLTGASLIEISDGATLKLYVGGGLTIFSGAEVLNHSEKASAFTYYGLPTNTNVVLEGTQRFEGVIWAPQADVTLNGGEHDVTDFVGICAARSIRLNGDYRFHYDEALGLMIE